MDKIKNGYALDMSKLVNQLRVKAGVMEMGEHIAWGSDTALMRDAADRIEVLEDVERERNELAALKAQWQAEAVRDFEAMLSSFPITAEDWIEQRAQEASDA